MLKKPIVIPEKKAEKRTKIAMMRIFPIKYFWLTKKAFLFDYSAYLIVSKS